MGDRRFAHAARRVQQTPHPASIQLHDDTTLVQALAARPTDPYLANVLASELHNRLRRKNAILDAAGEGLCTLDADGRVVFLNPAAEKLLGRSARDDPWDLHALVHGPTPHESCPLALAIATRRSVQVEEDLFHAADGRSFRASYTASPVLRDGEVDGHTLVLRDMTHSRRMVAALEHSEERLAAALALTGTTRWDWDARADRMTWTDGATTILGHDLAEEGATLRAFLDLLPPADASRLAHTMRRACETRRDFLVRHAIRRADGTLRRIETRGRFAYDATDAAVSAWGTHRDLHWHADGVARR